MSRDGLPRTWGLIQCVDTMSMRVGGSSQIEGLNNNCRRTWVAALEAIVLFGGQRESFGKVSTPASLFPMCQSISWAKLIFLRTYRGLKVGPVLRRMRLTCVETNKSSNGALWTAWVLLLRSVFTAKLVPFAPNSLAGACSHRRVMYLWYSAYYNTELKHQVDLTKHTMCYHFRCSLFTFL